MKTMPRTFVRSFLFCFKGVRNDVLYDISVLKDALEQKQNSEPGENESDSRGRLFKEMEEIQQSVVL